MSKTRKGAVEQLRRQDGFIDRRDVTSWVLDGAFGPRVISPEAGPAFGCHPLRPRAVVPELRMLVVAHRVGVGRAGLMEHLAVADVHGVVKRVLAG